MQNILFEMYDIINEASISLTANEKLITYINSKIDCFSMSYKTIIFETPFSQNPRCSKLFIINNLASAEY